MRTHSRAVAMAMVIATVVMAVAFWPSPASAAVPTDNVFPIQGRDVSVCANSFGAARPGGRTHEGDDCFADEGTPLLAVESGVVEDSGTSPLGGNVIWLRGDSGTWYYYAHNSVNLVNAPVRVNKGQVIARVGKTGNAAETPPHVHFEIHPGSRGAEPIDPNPYLAQWSTAGTAPPKTHLLWLQSDGLSSGRASRSFVYGLVGDVPIVGDWNGDGVDSPGIYRPGTAEFHLRNSNSDGGADITFRYGTPGQGQWPVAGDWNGDGRDTIGIYETGTNRYMLRNSNSAGSADATFTYGIAGDQPFVGDWDGDGDDNPGVKRGVTWLLRNSNSAGPANFTFDYGRPGDHTVVGDWNGNFSDGIGVVRNNNWLLRYTLSGGDHQISFTFGHAGDTFLPGDWNGNRTPGPGVIRPV